MTRELLQQALDALNSTNLDLHVRAMDAIRAHLAKPQVEPVAWMTKDGRVANADTVGTAMPAAPKASFSIPLYTHPSSTETQPERPVNCGSGHCSCIECVVAQETCKWTQSNEWWSAACGASWAFIDCGPVENGVNFCHGCGKPVEIEETP